MHDLVLTQIWIGNTHLSLCGAGFHVTEISFTLREIHQLCKKHFFLLLSNNHDL